MSSKKDLSKKLIDDSAKSLVVQKEITDRANQTLGEVRKDINKLSHVIEKQNQLLDELLEMIESKKTKNKAIDLYEIKDKANQTHLNATHYDKLDTLLVSDDKSWERFIEKTTEFAFSIDINLEKNPLYSLLSRSEMIILTNRLQKVDQILTPDCDIYDLIYDS